MSDQKPNNKHALLNELESIKELLFEDGDGDEFDPQAIPTLDNALENIESSAQQNDSNSDENDDYEPLLLDTLQLDVTLNDHIADEAFDPLALGKGPLIAPPNQAASNDAGEKSLTTLFEYIPVLSNPNADTGTDSNVDADESDKNSPAAHSQSDTEKPAPENIFQRVNQYTPSQSSSPAVKARGENPFLPKHIRDRLQGNRAPEIVAPIPLNPALRPSAFARKPKVADNDASNNINNSRVEQLMDALVAEFLPQMEAKLRQQLQPIVEQQLQESQHQPAIPESNQE